MNLLLIPITILLVGMAVWLWCLSKAQVTSISLGALIAPVQRVTLAPVLKPSIFNIWYKKAIAIITKIFPIAIYVGLILSIVYIPLLIYEKYPSFIKDLTIILIIIIISALIGFIVSKRRKDVDYDVICYGDVDYDVTCEHRESSYNIPKKSIKYEGEAILPSELPPPKGRRHPAASDS